MLLRIRGRQVDKRQSRKWWRFGSNDYMREYDTDRVGWEAEARGVCEQEE